MTPVRAMLAVYVFVVALFVGSFLNVVIARVPAGRNIAWPGSACPRCGDAWHTTPALSC